MSDDFLTVPCPECHSILIVRRRDGKVVEVRKPIVEESTGDRFEDAMRKVKRASSEIEKKVESATERERQKMDRLNRLFQEGLDQARKEGDVQKPHSDLDLD